MFAACAMLRVVLLRAAILFPSQVTAGGCLKVLVLVQRIFAVVS